MVYPRPGLELATYIVDEYSPDYAYGLRKLSSSATNAIRVRRASDNAEQDIGFDGDDLDTTSLESFCSATDGFVVKLYDQAGSSDLVQTTNSSQPQIVSSGTTITGVDNSLPAIKHDNGAGEYLTNTATFSGKESTTIMVESHNTNYANTSAMVFLGSTGATGTVRSYTTEYYMRMNTTKQDYDSYTDTDQTRLHSIYSDSGASTIDNYNWRRDGSLLTPDSLNGGTLGNISSNINYAWDGSGSNQFIGRTQELIVFASSQSTTTIGDIEDNINAYYSIYIEYIVDEYSPTVAYSVRKLSSTATNCMRVRRASDNTEQDIGFSGDDLDTASLESFCSATDGFIVTWYDQSGNSYDVTNATTASQPKIVSSGTTITKGSKPAAQFDGTNDVLIYGTGVLNTDTCSMFAVSASTSTETVGTVYSSNTSAVDGVNIFQDSRTSVNRHVIIRNTSPVNYIADLSTARVDTNQRLLASFVDSSKNISAFDNSATGGTATHGGTIPSNDVQLGRQGSSSSYLDGYLQEFIGINTDESSDRTKIEDNINTYYSIF